MRLTLLLVSFLAFIKISFAQTLSKDSTTLLKEISIKAYLSDQPLMSLPASVLTLNNEQLEQRNINSLLPSLNSLSGVKMEERSPGSYRLSVRGSLLRSPFGVRNLKIYFDDFPLTDAGGNTYLNLIDQNSIKNIEILKGPDGSLFGANSGGVIIINSLSDKKINKAAISGGSYGLASEYVGFQNTKANYAYTINQAYQRSEGYRDNSASKRFYLQTQQKWNYSDKGQLKFSGFYADMDYETPGGLTQQQFDTNPRAARANAEPLGVGIKNKTLFGGLANEFNFTNQLKHVVSVSGIYTDFENPFFTNHENRTEKSFAVRSYFELKNKAENTFKIQWNLGGEYQFTNADIINNVYRSGLADSIAADRIKNNVGFIFNRVALQIGEHIKSELSVSLNFSDYAFESLPQSVNITTGSKRFEKKLMPRLSTSYLFNPQFSLRGIISKGYSLPTTAEVRASDARINPDLEPEEGWNYELGLRIKTPSERIYADVSAFYYRMDNAIVRRVNANDQDYFVNAGGTNQKGLEVQFNAEIIKSSTSLIKDLNWNSAITLSDFKFRDYKIGSNDFSGNFLTGVPKINLVNSLNFNFIKSAGLFIQHQFNGKTSLNDAETIFAEDYHLVQLKLLWNKQLQKQVLGFQIGADNLLNEKYSLGNDINAFGNRYFNPSAKRNYFASVSLKW